MPSLCADLTVHVGPLTESDFPPAPAEEAELHGAGEHVAAIEEHRRRARRDPFGRGREHAADPRRNQGQERHALAVVGDAGRHLGAFDAARELTHGGTASAGRVLTDEGRVGDVAHDGKTAARPGSLGS